MDKIGKIQCYVGSTVGLVTYRNRYGNYENMCENCRKENGGCNRVKHLNAYIVIKGGPYDHEN